MPPLPLESKRLYDMANRLDNGQEWQIEMDAARLTSHGIPTLIVVQAGDMTPQAAEAFAADVRRSWDVESRPGADDGLVMLVIADASDATRVFTTMSWGANALPHFGVTETTAARIQAAWMQPNLAEGRIYEAIDHTLRRLIYHAIYDPAPQAPLSDAQSAVRGIISAVSPVLALLAVALAFARRGRTDRGVMLPVGALLAASSIASLAVWSRSEWGILAALVVLGVAIAGWLRPGPGARDGAPAYGQARP
jgi:uncharacterized membrane protein YgcG